MARSSLCDVHADRSHPWSDADSLKTRSQKPDSRWFKSPLGRKLTVGARLTNSNWSNPIVTISLETGLNHQFSRTELARLEIYRSAVQADFFNEFDDRISLLARSGACLDACPSPAFHATSEGSNHA
jgi:hypothetical protein